MQIIFCTCPDNISAENIARLLVQNQLAACVNIVPGITSIYTWEGKVESAQEHLLIIKAGSLNYQSIESAIHKHHPYQLPEIIAIPVERGLPEYLNWIETCHSSN
jgi:periplasmic divalent cation tolerance protein